jgi:hypothetical protein
MFRFTVSCFAVIGLIGCGSLSSITPSAPSAQAGIDEVLPTSFAEADSLYNSLGTTMSACTTNATFGKLSVVVLKKTVTDEIADVAISYDGTQVLRDSVDTTNLYGVDVLVNNQFVVQSVAVILGDKNYSGTAMLRRLIVNGEVVAGIYPFGEAKLFGDDKIISYQFFSDGSYGGRGVSTKRYIVYDVATKSIVCQFDDQ